MKALKSTRDNAILLAVLVMLYFGLILWGSKFILVPGSIGQIAAVAAAGGLGVFFFVRFFFVRYVEEQISPIIDTIQSFTLPRTKLRKRIDEGELLPDLTREVKIWADNQSEEIKKLRETEKYRKDFLGNVSHELKTPIFNIQGYILTLSDGGIEDRNVNKLYLKRAEKSINRLISIVDDLESISRLESGEFKLKIETFNLVRVIEDVIEGLEMLARRQSIRIVFDSSYNKTIMVKADKKRIIEVLDNLLGNSVKYGREGGKTTIGFVDKGENILVDISDNGIGIEEKSLPRVFERFYRVDKSRSRESGGTGLGLSIVKHTIQAHNQTITVRSKVDHGTTFVFSLDKA